MGQKVNAHGLRVGIIKDWDSIWYAEKDFGKFLVEDQKIRKFIKKELHNEKVNAKVPKILIHRTAERVKVTIYTAAPGIVIGRNGDSIQKLTAKVQKLTDKKVFLNIEEVKRPELSAQLVAEDIALQLENRVSFRRAMKQAMQRTMKMGAIGMKTSVSGRLGGAEMARTEGYSEGRTPMHTLRANIDYGFAEADTTYGKIGVKVWINTGEILTGMKRIEKPETNDRHNNNRRDRGDRRDRGGDRPQRGERRDRTPRS
ncbi:MAG: 30S ribosomal protein S3 [Defluviitaleaceae bacterium]|nr:30S ribosomal protein S3 [Defluviitaleaceae bacterium]